MLRLASDGNKAIRVKLLDRIIHYFHYNEFVR